MQMGKTLLEAFHFIFFSLLSAVFIFQMCKLYHAKINFILLVLICGLFTDFVLNFFPFFNFRERMFSCFNMLQCVSI